MGIPGHKPSGECPPCERTRQDLEHKETMVFAEQNREQRRKQILANMGINVRVHGHLRLQDMDERIRNPCRLWVRKVMESRFDEVIDGLYLYGEVGTGKTQTAVSIISEFLELGFDPKRLLYDEARNLITQVQDLYGDHGRVRPYQERREQVDVWLFDDAGTEKFTADSLRIIEGIVNAREGAPTVITSNLEPHEWATKWGNAEGWQRLASRLQRFAVLDLHGSDHRRG